MHRVRINALVGSPREEDTANGAKNGMMPSLAIACDKRTFIHAINCPGILIILYQIFEDTNLQ